MVRHWTLTTNHKALVERFSMGLVSGIQQFWSGWFAGDPGMDDRYYEDSDLNDFRAVLGAANRHGILVTDEVALRFSAVFACVRLVSQYVAMLPWHVYRRDGETRITVSDHVVSRLIALTPNNELDAVAFRQALMSAALLTGNGYAEIERNRIGDPVNLWLLHPDHVMPKRDEQENLIYEITDKNQPRTLEPKNIIHIKGLCYGNTLAGISPVRYAAESIGLGLAVERFGSQFFGNGTALSGVLEHPGTISETAAKNITNSFKKIYSGFSNAHKVAVLEQGMKFNKISIPPEEAQFLATREFQVTEIARWFGVPPHKIADLSKATFSNIEHQSKEFVDDALMPWARRLETEVQRKLFDATEVAQGYYTKLDFRGLLRGDSAARSEYYTKMLSNGVYSINEVRQLEDMNPVDGGDLRLVPLNMVSLERANSEGGTTPERKSSNENQGLFNFNGKALTPTLSQRERGNNGHGRL